LIFFNIGGIWNIISGWIENDMQDSTTDIKKDACLLFAEYWND